MSIGQRIDNLITQIDGALDMAQTDEKQDATNDTVYRWGIIGCGKISTDFANCLDKHPRCKIVACAARRLESAKEFANRFDIATFYDSYDSIANDKSIDIVYVGTIHPTHCSNVLLCLNNKKHVICEKSIGMNSNEASKMVECAQKNKVLLLEAMWTRFFPAIKKIKTLINEENAIGDVVSFLGDFGLRMPSPENAPRLWDIKLGGGSILDLGIYVVAPLCLVFGAKYPNTISAVGKVVNGIDSMMNAVIKYGDGEQWASINCNFYATTPEEHSINGTKGRIIIHSPAHCPTSFTLVKFGNHDSVVNNKNKNSGIDVGPRDVVSTTTETFKNAKGFRVPFNFPGSEGLYYEVQECVDCLDKGLIESPNYTHKEMMIIHQIMDELRKQIGVKYEQDQ